MMEQIRGYLVLTALFFLLFLVAAFLFGRYKKKKHSFAKENFQLLKKVPWDIIIKGLAAAGFILFSRKLIYYVPFDGVIQTKFSIWWVEGNAQTLRFISIIVFFVIWLGLLVLEDHTKKEGCFLPILATAIVAVLCYVEMNAVFDDLKIQLSITGRDLILIIFTPLLELKILCSGKYLGLFTSLILGYIVAAGYKKLIPRISKNRKIKIITSAMFLIVVLMLLIFWGDNVYKSLGNPRNWEQQLNNKVLSVTAETDMMDLLDAVHSLYREEARYQSLEPIVAFLVKEKEFHWKKEIYQRVIEEVKTLAGYHSSRLLGKIVLWIAKTGNIPWAKAIAENIPDREIKDNTLTEIREKIEKK